MLLDEEHQVDEVRGQPEHRAAVLAVAEPEVVGEERAVAGDLREELAGVFRRARGRGGLRLRQLDQRDGLHGGVRRCLRGRIVDRDGLLRRQPRLLDELVRIQRDDLARGVEAGVQQLQRCTGVSPGEPRALMCPQVPQDLLAVAVVDVRQLQRLDVGTVRRVVEREQVRAGIP